MSLKLMALSLMLGCTIALESTAGASSPFAVIEQLPLSRVEITGGFWAEKRAQLEKVVLPSQWEQLEAHHNIDNFRVLAGVKQGVHQGPVYIDSDLYKWLEAACYVSGKHPEDQRLAERIEELTGLIAKVQMPDGYLNTYYQSFAPERRFTNLVMNHELYCAGHFIEAACAHKEATGKDGLLKVAVKLADHIDSQFGPGKNPGVPGHEEIELALVRLYRATGDKKYLEKASWFINQRGRYTKYPKALLKSLQDQSELAQIVNEKRRPWLEKAPQAKSAAGYIVGSALLDLRIPWEFLSGKYFQDDKPLLDMTVAEGHAVRAMYFFTGAADVYLETGDKPLLSALEKIWDNTISKRTYITGGMGSLPGIEGFGRDYELPNRSYTETCAAIGSFFWNFRMLLATADASYAELMEKTLYNAILPALALDGRSYFYQNPLTSSGRDHRSEWYGCACCPPNIARLFASLERYIFGRSKDRIWVHQYISSSAQFEQSGQQIRLELESGFPWSGDVKIKIRSEKPSRFALMLRIPSWAQGAELAVNASKFADRIEPGKYLELAREWKNGDELLIHFPFAVRLLDSPPQVKKNRGKVALMRGPLIYCLESIDNPGLKPRVVALDRSAKVSAEKSDILGGVMVLKARTKSGQDLTLIPYYAWCNRGPSLMEVWLKI